jgi:hypothetical protein
MAELEQEVEQALAEQVMLSASALNSLRPPCSVEAPPGEGRSQDDRSETTGSRPEEP